MAVGAPPPEAAGPGAASIRRLPPELANQIAAGEVVERPASVVKELLENAIDAHARHVAVTIELGGKRLIRVVDDGEGMSPDDARLAVERHATSKIRSAGDLAAILTLGFRGEALPSIASVSRFTLRTRARGAVSGTEVEVHAGILARTREIGAAEGTSIEVVDLFHNLPARRKFLKADAAEAAQVTRILTQIALAYPEVGVRLESAGRRAIDCPPAASFAERFHQLYGDRPGLVPVSRESGALRVHGLVAALTEDGPARGPQNVFVNRRMVKDKTIAHAVMAAYATATIRERSPEIHLFIDLPPDRVDVNVHPTKAEVRFLDQGYVHESVRRAVSEALGAQAAPHLSLSAPCGEPVPTAAQPLPRVLPGVLDTMGGAHRWRDVAGQPGWDGPDGGLTGPRRAEPRMDDADGFAAAGDEPGPEVDPRVGTADAPPWPPEAARGVAVPAGARQAGVDALRPMLPLGQFRDTYIVAVDEDGLLIIDQHVAHERVLFEQIGERLTRGRLPSQRLIAPLLLDVSPAQAEALLQHRAELDQLGIEIDEFGAGSLRVASVPALLAAGDVEATLRALADDLDGLDRGSRAHDAVRRIAATMACHAAVKANYPLTIEKMRHILDELRRTAHSAVCPHGRPVVLRLTRREIEKNFQRI